MLREADAPGASVAEPSGSAEEVDRSVDGSIRAVGVGAMGRAADRVVVGGVGELVEAVHAADALWAAALDAWESAAGSWFRRAGARGG